MDIVQLVLTSMGWMAKWCKTCIDLRASLILTKVSASYPKSMQVHARPGQTELQVDPSCHKGRSQDFSRGCVKVRVLTRLSCRFRHLLYIVGCVLKNAHERGDHRAVARGCYPCYSPVSTCICL